MDIVTKNLVSSFKKEESLSDDIDEPTLFEHFANFCVVSQNYGEEFQTDEVHTGGGDDLGIDGFAIIANGTMVRDMNYNYIHVVPLAKIEITRSVVPPRLMLIVEGKLE